MSCCKNKWRLRNTKGRNSQRKRNCTQSRAWSSHEKEPWALHEIMEIAAENRPSDRELSKKLKRSVQAIQNKRYKVMLRRQTSAHRLEGGRRNQTPTDHFSNIILEIWSASGFLVSLKTPAGNI